MGTLFAVLKRNFGLTRHNSLKIQLKKEGVLFGTAKW